MVVFVSMTHTGILPYQVGLIFESVDNISKLSVAIQLKALQQLFPIVLVFF